MEWSLAVGVWVESRAAITPERTRRRKNVDQDDNCAVRCHCSEPPPLQHRLRPRNKKSLAAAHRLAPSPRAAGGSGLQHWEGHGKIGLAKRRASPPPRTQIA